MNNIIEGTLAAFLICLFAGLGGALVFLKRKYNKENINFLLNMAAGVMLASSVFTLLSPAANTVINSDSNHYVAALLVAGAVVIGICLVWLIHLFLPHKHDLEHMPKNEILNSRSAWLFVWAIAIHKFPEGLAVGVAYAGEQINNPLSLSVGMALQNIPEGLMIALSLVAAGWSRLRGVGIAFLTGLMQPIGAIVGIITAAVSATFIPFAMAIAGGCMLFVIINEIIPQTYGCGENSKQTLAIMFGFVLMMYINMILG